MNFYLWKSARTNIISTFLLQIGRTTLCKECSRRIQFFDDLKEFGARSSALRNNLVYNVVPEKIQLHHNGKPSNRKKYIRRKIACKCMLCQKEFQSKCYLHKHMKRHQNVKNAYKCMICNSEFLSANSLSAHEKTHPTYKWKITILDWYAVCINKFIRVKIATTTKTQNKHTFLLLI